MVTRVTSRDYEKLSAYLDGQLTGKDLQRLETRLAQDALLQDELKELRRMRAVLRSLPRPRAPRNFTLTPAMVGVKSRQPTRLYPLMGFASALASLLFVLMVLGDFLGFIPSYLPRSSEPSAIQEDAPVALLLTEDSPLAPDAQMKSAPAEESVAMSAESSLNDDTSRLAPTEEEGMFSLQMPSPKELVPSESAESTPMELYDAAAGTGMGGGIETDTLLISPETLTPTTTGETYNALLGIEASALITPTATPTFTPTPMPTETPLPTVVPVLVPTATSTPTPMPTETPLAAQLALAEAQPTATPTAEVLALAVEEAAEPAASGLEYGTSADTGPYLAEREANQPESSLRPVLLIQVGLLILALITGVAFLVLRGKERQAG